MKPQTEMDIRQHALEEYPREACGLVVYVNGKETYRRCRNTSSDKANFVLDPRDLADAEDAGEVVALVHTHPDTNNAMSEADRVMCEASEMPWYIMAVTRDGDQLTAGELARYEPSGYEAPLLGRPFVFGVLDCYTLIRDYYQRILKITLPDFPREDGFWERGEDLYMQQFALAGFRPINTPIREHDVIIMQIRSPVANHGGVYIGNSQVLHHLYGRLSARDVYGGYFQEVTRVVIRHKELA